MILLVLGLFPSITYKLTHLIGIISPANFIFLVIIFLLMEKVFTMSILQSQMEDKITILSAELALRAHSAERRIAKESGEEESKNKHEV